MLNRNTHGILLALFEALFVSVWGKYTSGQTEEVSAVKAGRVLKSMFEQNQISVFAVIFHIQHLTCCFIQGFRSFDIFYVWAQIYTQEFVCF